MLWCCENNIIFNALSCDSVPHGTTIANFISSQPVEVKSNITDNESAKMKTNKGTIQGVNGVATVDKKHQIIIDATGFGEGQKYHTLALIQGSPIQAI